VNSTSSGVFRRTLFPRYREVRARITTTNLARKYHLRQFGSQVSLTTIWLASITYDNLARKYHYDNLARKYHLRQFGSQVSLTTIWLASITYDNLARKYHLRPIWLASITYDNFGLASITYDNLARKYHLRQFGSQVEFSSQIVVSRMSRSLFSCCLSALFAGSHFLHKLRRL